MSSSGRKEREVGEGGKRERGKEAEKEGRKEGRKEERKEERKEGRKEGRNWRCSSVVEGLPSVLKALGSIHSTIKGRKKGREGRKGKGV
jgi:hypothetical protein